jgi:hypothetical protein
MISPLYSGKLPGGLLAMWKGAKRILFPNVFSYKICVSDGQMFKYYIYLLLLLFYSEKML